MKKPNFLRLFLSGISFALLISCGTLPQPPDVPTCKHIGQRIWTDKKSGHLMMKPSPICMRNIGEAECGFCTTIIKGTEFFVGEKAPYIYNNKPWSQLREESILMPSEEAYAPLSSYIINACHTFNCDDEVDRFKVKIDSINDLDKKLKTH